MHPKLKRLFWTAEDLSGISYALGMTFLLLAIVWRWLIGPGIYWFVLRLMVIPFALIISTVRVGNAFMKSTTAWEFISYMGSATIWIWIGFPQQYFLTGNFVWCYLLYIGIPVLVTLIWQRHTGAPLRLEDLNEKLGRKNLAGERRRSSF